MKLIKQDWHTEGQGRLEGGVVRWRGFPGTYLIKVNGRELNVLLTPDAPGCTVRMAPQQAVE
jgi:hypothetical protein